MFVNASVNLAQKAELSLARVASSGSVRQFKSGRASRWRLSCLFWKVIKINENERGLLYRAGRLVKVLEPGEFKFSIFNLPEKVDVFDVVASQSARDHIALVSELLKGRLPCSLEEINLSSDEVGFFYSKGRLDKVLDPGSTLFIWKGVQNVNVETINIDEDYYSYAGA